MAAAAGGGPLLPEDLVVWEILIRVPAKTLLRCRAVCRSWRRRLTSDAKFLLAHHRRQPSLPLLTKGDRTTEERRIDALDHRTGERRPVARTTGWTAANAGDLNVLASCDGLLILLANGGLQICNPATRQRAPLTLLHGASCISALYPHRPFGSYRVLCCLERAEDGRAVYHVRRRASRAVGVRGYGNGDAMPMMVYFHPHVVADGKIYWQPVMLPDGNGKVNNMVAFDTMAESFQQLLFQMNSGALGLYHYGGGTADLWVLQDHGSWSWSMNHRIKLPGLVYSLLPVLDPEGDVLDVLVLSQSVGSGNLWKHVQHISGANGSLLAQYEWSVYLKLSRHRFKESLVHHDFFSMDGNAGCVDEKPLFDGLSTVAVLRDDNSESH
ncbi:unnamed protein product [Miscanthus lutarioriparius]|uniref:F-box domain-containing protein n=1 Tax=Miscanthus lutarioriparius TaxID=422564 RepID=A0A811QHB4_9POAL|nr:unnamed protein product [Miscanthus lutarioriparius]